MRVSLRCSSSGLSYLTMTLRSWSSSPWQRQTKAMKAQKSKSSTNIITTTHSLTPPPNHQIVDSYCLDQKPCLHLTGIVFQERSCCGSVCPRPPTNAHNDPGTWSWSYAKTVISLVPGLGAPWMRLFLKWLSILCHTTITVPDCLFYEQLCRTLSFTLNASLGAKEVQSTPQFRC